MIWEMNWLQSNSDLVFNYTNSGTAAVPVSPLHKKSGFFFARLKNIPYLCSANKFFGQVMPV
jgi:hypothetical protein